MPRLSKPDAKFRKDLPPLVIRNRFKLAFDLGDFLMGIKRLDAGFPFAPSLVQVGRVFLLNAGTVVEHHRSDIGRGGGAENRALVALSDEAGEISAMVDVGM